MKKTLLFKIKSFRAKSVRIEKVFPLPQLRGALFISLRKALMLCGFVNEGVVKQRTQIAYSFLEFIVKMNREHGPTFTIK